MNARPARQNAVPLGFFGLALLLVALAVPTVLRPPVDPTNNSAEFSPDAPPDDTQESIISTLSRGVSATSGDGAGEAPVAGDDANALPANVPAPTAAPRACPRGFGNPPRQTESLYSAPCGPAFVGDNGGATHKGVTATEVRVAAVYRGGDTGMVEGPVSDEPSATEDDQNRTLRVYQNYFNTNFQLYGRQLRLYAVSIPTDPAKQAAAAADLEQTGIFASIQLGGASVPYNNEANRRGLVTFGSLEFADDWYSQRAPLAWNWRFGSTTAFRLSAEYICKKLSGKPASFGGPDVATTKRKLGMLYYAESGSGTYERNGEHMEKALRDQCGEHLAVVVSYDLRDTNNVGQQIATSMAKMRQEGVTTILYGAASVQIPQFTAQADQLAYQPEWFLLGLDEVDAAAFARRGTATQWSHAFGISLNELPRPETETDAFRAYHSIDPENDPDSATAPSYYSLLQLLNGIQLAGPKLTPETFAKGLYSAGKRRPEPVWSVGGGFAPGDQTFADYAAEMWWDPSATDPVSGEPGAYRYVGGGKRFTFGQVTTEGSLMFKDGAVTGW